MVSLGFDKKIAKIAMNIIDKTLGKKFPMIDKLTDVFQEQDKRFKELEREVSAIKDYIKENDK